jgi:hypothetical protein
MIGELKEGEARIRGKEIADDLPPFRGPIIIYVPGLKSTPGEGNARGVGGDARRAAAWVANSSGL